MFLLCPLDVGGERLLKLKQSDKSTADNFQGCINAFFECSAFEILESKTKYINTFSWQCLKINGAYCMMLEYSKDNFHANRYDGSISEWFQWIQKAELDARLCKQDLEDLSELQNCFSLSVPLPEPRPDFDAASSDFPGLRTSSA